MKGHLKTGCKKDGAKDGAGDNEYKEKKGTNEHAPGLEDPAREFFSCTDGERAAFEVGIKMGTLFHQFVGVPLSLSNVDALEKAMEESLRVQPFVKEAVVSISREGLHEKEGEYDYTTLTPERIKAKIVTCYLGVTAEARMEYQRDIRYPLMRLKVVAQSSSV